MSLEQTPSKELQFCMESEDSSPQDTPSTQSMTSPEQCDSFVVVDDASIDLCGEIEVEGKSISLAAKAKKDEALWPDEHTSDEEEYVDGKENEEPKEHESDSGESDADDEPCKTHKECIAAAGVLLDNLKAMQFSLKGRKKEALNALVEAVCDHFDRE